MVVAKMASKEQRDLERQQLAEKLDEDLEQHLEEVYEKNKDFKYQDGFKEDDSIEEQIRRIPAFSNELPTQEDIDNSPALQALQAIKYESENPHECALSHKEDGNFHFQKKDYKTAVKAYTEGIKIKHEDNNLTAFLYTNRAAANFHLGNNRSALNDAVWALKFKPDHMKAIVRGSICCFDLEKYDDCMEWCEKVYIDAKEKKLLELKKKSIHQKKQQERDRRKNEMKAIKDLTARNQLIETIKSRGVTIEHADAKDSTEELSKILLNNASPHSGKIYLDENKKLHWPVYLLYPEYNQSDFIQDYCEDIRFIDQLNVVFETLPDWDLEKNYQVSNVKVYFEDVKRSVLVEIPQEKSLREVLADKRFMVRGGCPAFLLMSSKTKFYHETFENQKAEQY